MCHILDHNVLFIVHALCLNQDKNHEPIVRMYELCLYHIVHRHKKNRPSQHVAFGLRLLTYGLVTPFMTGVVVAVVQVHCMHE